MKSGLADLKNDLRQQIRERLKKRSAVQREEASAKACASLLQQPLWKNVNSILFYAPLPNELNIWALLPDALASGKTVCLPRFDAERNVYSVCQIQNLETDLAPGKFGILEPLNSCYSFPLNRLDLALVPGVAFDPRGGRLGRGGGYYDRLLAQFAGTKCGVAFDEQVVALVPIEPHDIRLNCILTPTRWLSMAGAFAE